MNMNDIFRKILNEAFFGKKDIDDHGFEYLRQVLDNLENNNTISLKTKGSTKGVETDITHLKNGEFNNNIQNFKKWLNSDGSLENVGTLNDYKNTESVESARQSLLQQFFNSFNLNFTDIEKTDYSIIRTPEQESIQAIFLAAKLKGKKYFDNISALYAPNADMNSEECKKLRSLFYENDLGITLTNNIIDFSKEKNKEVLKKLANILKIDKFPQEFENLKNTEFTIIHPDGLKNTNNEEVAELTKVLFGNGIKWEVENQGYSLSLKKDNFIPADLYIIPLNKIDDIKEMIDAAGNLDPYSIVDLSNKLMGNNEINMPLIFPISLKMPSNNPKITKIINSKNENIIRVGMNNIKFIHFNEKGNSTMGIKYGDKKLVLEFRSKGKNDKTGEHKPWQCNAKNKDNTNAIEGGSAKNYMRFVFRDSMNDSITETDVKEIANIFKDKIHSPSFTEALEKSFKRFFEDEDNIEETDYNEKENESSWDDIEKRVLLAVPSNPKVRGESSSKEGCIGLGLFCKKLIENGIEGSGNYNEALSKIVQMSFKMNEIVQDTWKIT